MCKWITTVSCVWVLQLWVMKKKTTLESITELTIVICYGESVQQSMDLRNLVDITLGNHMSQQRLAYNLIFFQLWSTGPVNLSCLKSHCDAQECWVIVTQKGRESRQLQEIEGSARLPLESTDTSLAKQLLAWHLSAPNSRFPRAFHWPNWD